MRIDAGGFLVTVLIGTVAGGVLALAIDILIIALLAAVEDYPDTASGIAFTLHGYSGLLSLVIATGAMAGAVTGALYHGFNAVIEVLDVENSELLDAGD